MCFFLIENKIIVINKYTMFPNTIIALSFITQLYVTFLYAVIVSFVNYDNKNILDLFQIYDNITRFNNDVCPQ